MSNFRLKGTVYLERDFTMDVCANSFEEAYEIAVETLNDSKGVEEMYNEDIEITISDYEEEKLSRRELSYYYHDEEPELELIEGRDW